MIGTIQDGESKQVTFLVTAEEKSTESTYTYSVVVDNASTGATYVTGEKTVFVPAAVAASRLYISSAEVFIDIDPGQGSGQVMTTIDGFFDEQTEDVTASVNISSLNYGYHTVYVRGEDSNGVWGAAVAYRFYHTSSIAGEFYEPPRNVIVTDVPDDQGHSLRVSWTLSQDDALITHYTIYRSRNPHLTSPVSIESLKSPEALIETEKVSTILVSSVPQGVNTFTDTSLPEGGIQYYYWVEAASSTGASEKVAAGILTAVSEKTYEFRVQAPYPNPFNPSTIIQYEVAEQCHVRLVVYDILGREVAILEDGVKPAGIHHALWNGYDKNGMLAGTGLYLFRFNAGKFTANGKLTFMR